VGVTNGGCEELAGEEAVVAAGVVVGWQSFRTMDA
jgi:hypothetical protein